MDIDGPRIIAGGIVAVGLLTIASVPATSKLGVAFAYLILIGAALAAGPTAFGRLSALVSAPTGGPTPKGAAHKTK